MNSGNPLGSGQSDQNDPGALIWSKHSDVQATLWDPSDQSESLDEVQIQDDVAKVYSKIIDRLSMRL